MKLTLTKFAIGLTIALLGFSARVAAQDSIIPPPAGYGHYCSLSYQQGGWAFSWSDAGKDICAEMLKKSPGGTIERAGLFSLSGPNNVVYTCNTGVGLLKGNGQSVLQSAFNDSAGKKQCVFTVAPRDLPVFEAPFKPSPKIHLNSGFDFARGYPVQTNNGLEATDVNYKDDGVQFIDDHDGFDFVMPSGTPLLAIGPGVILVARTRDVKKYNCQTPIQKEVYVLHTIGAGSYREEFVAYYAHLSSIDSGIVPGAVVTAGQELGLSGNTGCSSEPHLHFGISRFTNTAAGHFRDHTVPNTEDYDKKTVIDPWGFSWTAKAGFDPWAWRRADQGYGALSINLWKAALAPPRTW